VNPTLQSIIRRCRRVFPKILSLAILSLSLHSYASSADLPRNKRVLMVAEMGMSSPPVFVVTREVTRILHAAPDQTIDFYFESLDTNLFSDEASQARIENWLLEKYADRKPDVIIAAGPSSLRFIATSKGFFPDVPVVFVGAFKEQEHTLDLTGRFTGVWFQFHPARTLDAALLLKPDTQHIYVVGGVSPLDRFAENIFHSSLHPYEKQYQFTYLTDLEMPALLDRLRSLPPHSVVLFSLFFLDPAGRRFIPESQALPAIVHASAAPVFALDDVAMGSGVVGGYVSSFAGQGRAAADDVLKILDGISPGAIPQTDGAAQYTFDWNAMKRWGLDKRDLPPGSVVLFREPTVWERYKPQILATALVIFLLSILSVYLAIETFRRKRAESVTAAALRFEQIISELSTYFIELAADRIDSGISHALDRLVQVLTVDRITVFRFNPAGTELEALYFSTTFKTPAGKLFAGECGWYFSTLLNRGNVVLNRLADLPSTDMKPAFERHGVASTVAVPIEVEGKVFGCLSFVQTKRETVWTKQIVAQFRMVGQVIANALARKQTDEQRQELSGLLINAEESERTRLARELHDDFSQRIAVLAVDLERLPKKMAENPAGVKKRLAELLELTTGIGADLHSLSHRLHSSTLDSLGLVDALESLCEEFAMQSEIDVSFVHEDVPEQLDPEIALCLFRVVQEALTNVRKHSQALEVAVRISGKKEALELSIRDDGGGFSIDDSAKRVGLGLRSMQERVHLVNGELRMLSVNQQGTTIDVHVPLRSVDSLETQAGPAILKSRIGG
jgi:signal transduction histidine kinase